ncbi:MAG: hypothetical protein ACO2PN_13330, partial [Pyrobaculum sp.]
EKFLEVVKKALEEQPLGEYCIHERDWRGYVVPRPRADKVYACGAYAALLHSYKLLVVPGAVVVYDVDLSGERCKVYRNYDAVVRLITWRPHYSVCIYDPPADLTRALICAY